MRFATLILAMAMLVNSNGLEEEQAQDFTGIWVATRETPVKLPLGPSAVFGGKFELKQTGQRLTVVRLSRDVSVSTEFSLDGTDTRIRVPGGVCMGDTGVVSSATLDGDAIRYRTTSTIPAGGGAPTAFNVTQILRMTGPATLEVEYTTRPAGETTPQQVAVVYRRTTEPMPPAAPKLPATAAPAKLADVAWIAGTWIGTSGTTTFEERWTPATGGAMLATSRTLRGTSLTAFEFLCIAERGDGLVYTAMPNARTPATDFVLTAVTASSATFENPAHDFPTKIVYALRADGDLEATISGDAGRKPTTLLFKKQ